MPHASMREVGPATGRWSATCSGEWSTWRLGDPPAPPRPARAHGPILRLAVADELTRFAGAARSRGAAARAASLDFDELRALGRLYRRRLGASARLRQRGDDPESIHHVNSSACEATRCSRLARRAGPEPTAPAPPRRRARAHLARAGRRLAAAAARRRDRPRPRRARRRGARASCPPRSDTRAAGSRRSAHSAERAAPSSAGEETPSSENALFGSWLFVHNTQVGLPRSRPESSPACPPPCSRPTTASCSARSPRSSCAIRGPWPPRRGSCPHGIPELTGDHASAPPRASLFGLAVAVPPRGGRARRAARRAGPRAPPVHRGAPALRLRGAGRASCASRSWDSAGSRSPRSSRRCRREPAVRAAAGRAARGRARLARGPQRPRRNRLSHPGWGWPHPRGNLS